MPTVDPTRLCQLLIEVSDLSRAKNFYQDVFGWHCVPADLLEMAVIDVPKDCPFGIALVPKVVHADLSQGPKQPSSKVGLKAVFAVDDPEAIVERCRSWESCRTSGPHTHPGYGLVWDITDPDGLTWGLFRKA